MSSLWLGSFYELSYCVPVDLCIPAFLDFSFAFPRSCSTFFSRSPVLSPSCFAFLCSCVKECMCGGLGATHHTFAACVWADQAGGVNSPSRHYPPSSHVRGVGVYWREAGLGSNSYLFHNPPLPPLLSVHVITLSSLHMNANLAFLCFPAFLYKMCVPPHLCS